ncbi:MAG: Peptidyl-prolyl cis-trans isomerase, partial [Pseudomonadota bacterium]
MTPNLYRRKIGALFSACALIVGMTVTPLLSQAQESPKVKIATNLGDIMVELYPD